MKEIWKKNKEKEKDGYIFVGYMDYDILLDANENYSLFFYNPGKCEWKIEKYGCDEKASDNEILSAFAVTLNSPWSFETEDWGIFEEEDKADSEIHYIAWKRVIGYDGIGAIFFIAGNNENEAFCDMDYFLEELQNEYNPDDICI